MNYSSENTNINFIDFGNSDISSVQINGKDLVICIFSCIAEENAPGNNTGKKRSIPKLRLTLSDFRIKSALLHGIPTLNIKDNTVRKSKERQLYKSELSALEERLCGGGDMDIFSLFVNESDVEYELLAEINIEDDERKWYHIKFACSHITAEWEKFGEPVNEKLTLKQRAAILKDYIPAVFLALGHKDTPLAAKIAAGAALGYALSPIDLIPDFIPVLGYLDDVLILSGLIAIAVKLIPNDVLAECAKKAAEGRASPKKRWYYSLPIIIIWLIIIGLIVSAIM
ncbi:MAG: YkvA family protein [Huintestinicola sp.]